MSQHRNLAHPEKIRRLYEEHPYPTADESTRRYGHWQLAPLEWMNALSKPGQGESAPDRILVAGCGTGREAFQMSLRFPEAAIIAVDFSPRSVSIARELQRRAPEMRNIRFLVADLASRGLSTKIGRDFDFVSCHGVLSYIPAPERALRNLARCLKPDGALYLGVNGAQHCSESWREFLAAFGFDMAEFRDGPYLREILKLCDVIGGNQGAGRLRKQPAGHLAGDLFGPLIQNLPLAGWLRIARDAGFHFQGSLSSGRALRPVLESEECRLLIPRSRAELCELVEIPRPAIFHRLLFTRQLVVNPPWEKHKALLEWRPALTKLHTCRLPKLSRSWQTLRKVTFKSRATHTRLDWQMPDWELEILRQSDGQRSLRQILERIPVVVPPDLLQRQLYLLYQLVMINLLPPEAAAQTPQG